MALRQAQAIAYGQSLVALAQSLVSLRDTCKSLQVKKGNNSYDTTWAAMSTAPVNADGTIGTKDATPVITNPIIDPVNSPPTYLLPSKTQLANLEAVIDAYLVFLDGSGVTTQLNRNGNLDPVVG